MNCLLCKSAPGTVHGVCAKCWEAEMFALELDLLALSVLEYEASHVKSALSGSKKFF